MGSAARARLRRIRRRAASRRRPDPGSGQGYELDTLERLVGPRVVAAVRGDDVTRTELAYIVRSSIELLGRHAPDWLRDHADETERGPDFEGSLRRAARALEGVPVKVLAGIQAAAIQKRRDEGG